MVRERDESGAFTTTTTLDDVLGVFETVDGPALTITDVADTLNISHESARQKLLELHEQEKVGRRKTERIVLYWQTDAPDDPETALKRLSEVLDEPIAVGDRVYEDGDTHLLTDEEETDR